MTLEELQDDIEAAHSEQGDQLSVETDRQTRHELAMLLAALDPEDTDELVRTAIHTYFQSIVDRGALDFHLRSGYDCTYDEYLSGMSYDQMTGNQFPQQQDNDDRRYQF